MRLVIAIIVLLVVSGFVIARFDRIGPTKVRANVAELTPEEYTDEGFRKVYGVTPLEFPRDHGPHPDYMIEWWYYTGNLADAEGNRFGYQFTIFRRGIVPAEPARPSEWAANQLYFAHFTVTDVTGETFEFHQRFNRAGVGLAGAQGLPVYHVWIDNWSVKEVEPGLVRIKAGGGNVGIDLLLEAAKPIALQGDRGFSAKSDEPGNASYYYSQTNNPTRGVITTARGSFEVAGNSWQDREWGTSDLPEGTAGWDWFSLQLDDDREVMFFTIREEDGGIYPGSSGLVVYPDGSTRYLTQDEVQVTVLDRWTSPASGATYPSEWRFNLPSEAIDLQIKPLLNDQELRLSQTYWEGAVRVEGSHSGYGYVEMTGYANSLRGRL